MNDPSSRRIGGYLMWTALATTCVTSLMFLTRGAEIPALELIRTTLHVQVTWVGWFWASCPSASSCCWHPWLAHKLYPPELKESPEVPTWARELHKLGPMNRREKVLAGLVQALAMWVFGGSVV